MALLPGYLAALERSWTPEVDVDFEGASGLLNIVRRAPESYLASLWNPEGLGGPVTLEDGAAVPRLPWMRYWISDGQYAGELNFRWQAGTSELPAYCLGHLGYAVVPWKRGRGYAAQAIKLLAPIARDLGLEFIEISMETSNLASRRTAEAAGAFFVHELDAGVEYGNQRAALYKLAIC